eukprot:scaffold68395_cov22-Tisochrysis_lutea.AAC.2
MKAGTQQKHEVDARRVAEGVNVGHVVDYVQSALKYMEACEGGGVNAEWADWLVRIAVFVNGSMHALPAWGPTWQSNQEPVLWRLPDIY